MNDDNEPVTKADLRSAIEEIDQSFTVRLDKVLETMRDIETHLLTEFHRYAQGTANRLHTLEVTDSDLKERLHLVELRLLELERRIRPCEAGIQNSLEKSPSSDFVMRAL